MGLFQSFANPRFFALLSSIALSATQALADDECSFGLKNGLTPAIAETREAMNHVRALEQRYRGLFDDASLKVELESLDNELLGWSNLRREMAELEGVSDSVREADEVIEKLADKIRSYEKNIRETVDTRFRIERTPKGGIESFRAPKVLRTDGVDTLRVTPNFRAHSADHFVESHIPAISGRDAEKLLKGKTDITPKSLDALMTEKRKLNTMFPRDIVVDDVLEELANATSTKKWVLADPVDSDGWIAYSTMVEVKGNTYGVRVVVCAKGPCARQGFKGQIKTLIPRCGPVLVMLWDGGNPKLLQGRPCDKYFP